MRAKVRLDVLSMVFLLYLKVIKLIITMALVIDVLSTSKHGHWHACA